METTWQLPHSVICFILPVKAIQLLGHDHIQMMAGSYVEYRTNDFHLNHVCGNIHPLISFGKICRNLAKALLLKLDAILQPSMINKTSLALSLDPALAGLSKSESSSPLFLISAVTCQGFITLNLLIFLQYLMKF